MSVMARLAAYAIAILAGHAVDDHPIWAGETCRYAGTTSYSGHVTVETKATAANGETTIDAIARVTARSFGVLNWQYLYEEIGIWRGGELQELGVNHRYSAIGSIRRQQWDVFRRTADGMTAYRVQSKTLADFRILHPGFVRHWDPATFGEPWLADYAAAPPARRPDLDLPGNSMPTGTGTPLSLGFYWVRWAAARARTVPVFLPGFKHSSRIDIPVVPLGGETNGLVHLRSTLRHPQLSASEASVADAWISPDHHLVRVTFDARGQRGSAQGELRLIGCQGEAPVP